MRAENSNALRDGLVEAIQRDDAVKVESLVLSGAPLTSCYYHRPGLSTAIPSKVGHVNPVDFAALEHRFRCAMQILELSDDRLAIKHDRQPNRAVIISIAKETNHAVNQAARHGHLGLLRLLLDRSASVGQQNGESQSALYVAVKHGHSEAASLLLQHGAWAVENQQSEVRQLASSQGVSHILRAVGSSTDNEQRRFIESSDAGPCDPQDFIGLDENLPIRGSVRISAEPPRISARRELWYQEGRPVAVWQNEGHQYKCETTSWGWSPLNSLPVSSMAASSGGAIVVPCPGAIGQQEELHAGANRLRGELCRAIRKGDLGGLQSLALRGAPLNAAFDIGFGRTGTCIDWATTSNHPDAALQLLKLGDVLSIGDALARNSIDALFWSVTMGHFDVLVELLHRRADVGARLPLPEHGSLLSRAVSHSWPSETRELLNRGAWELETEPERQRLLCLAHSRTPIAAVFRSFGLEKASEVPVLVRFRNMSGPDFSIHAQREATVADLRSLAAHHQGVDPACFLIFLHDSLRSDFEPLLHSLQDNSQPLLRLERDEYGAYVDPASFCLLRIPLPGQGMDVKT